MSRGTTYSVSVLETSRISPMQKWFKQLCTLRTGRAHSEHGLQLAMQSRGGTGLFPGLSGELSLSLTKDASCRGCCSALLGGKPMQFLFMHRQDSAGGSPWPPPLLLEPQHTSNIPVKLDIQLEMGGGKGINSRILPATNELSTRQVHVAICALISGAEGDQTFRHIHADTSNFMLMQTSSDPRYCFKWHFSLIPMFKPLYTGAVGL